MLETMLSFFWPEGMAGLTYGDMEFDVTKLQGTQDLIYETQDRYITAGAISDKEWAGMCRALNREDLIEDPRFKTAGDRFVNVEERKQITAGEIKKWASDEVLERLDTEGVPCAPLLTRMELMDHDQILANESINKTSYEGFGEVRQARPAARLTRHRARSQDRHPSSASTARAYSPNLAMTKRPSSHSSKTAALRSAIKHRRTLT